MMNAKEMMDWCNDYRSLSNGKVYKAKGIVKSVKDLMSKVDINKDDFRLILMDTEKKFGIGFSKSELLNMSFSDMIEWDKNYANPRYEVVLMVKTKPKYLDKVEENYLRKVLTPLKKAGYYNFCIEKYANLYPNGKPASPSHIIVYMKIDGEKMDGEDWDDKLVFPYLTSTKMYKKLEYNKKYSIDYLVE